jgi:hypothetical protein
MSRYGSLGLLLVSLALAAAAWASFQAPAAPPLDRPLIVEFEAIQLGRLPLGRHEFHVRVTNPNPEPRRILGLSTGCRTNVCFLNQVPGPILVPAGETVTCSWSIDVHSPGEFELPLALYLEENGIREVKQTVRGVGVAPKGTADAPAKD